MQNNFFTDRNLESSPTVEEATRKAQDLVKMSAKGGFTLTKLVSNKHGKISTRNWKKHPIDGNEKALAAENKFCHVLELICIYQFDTLVFSRGTSPDRNVILAERLVLSIVSAV